MKFNFLKLLFFINIQKNNCLEGDQNINAPVMENSGSDHDNNADDGI